jgi:hypothetical protein
VSKNVYDGFMDNVGAGLKPAHGYPVDGLIYILARVCPSTSSGALKRILAYEIVMTILKNHKNI